MIQSSESCLFMSRNEHALAMNSMMLKFECIHLHRARRMGHETKSVNIQANDKFEMTFGHMGATSNVVTKLKNKMSNGQSTFIDTII